MKEMEQTVDCWAGLSSVGLRVGPGISFQQEVKDPISFLGRG